MNDEPTQRETLSRDEVAAVSVDREYYVSDVPSPYLSSKQAFEDVRETKRRHTRRTSTLVTLGIIATLAALGWFVWQTIESQRKADVVHYETATIERMEFLDTVDTTTLVHPINEADVTCDTSGTIVELHISPGDHVEEGQPLFRLENRTISDAAGKALEALNAAKANAEAKAAALDRINASVTAAAQQAAAKPNDVAAQTVLANAQAMVPAAQAEFDAANTTLQTIQQTYDNAVEQQNRLTITAPISGTVEDFVPELRFGGVVNGASKLCAIYDTSSFLIQMEVPRESAPFLAVGQEVELTFPSIEDLHLTLSVSSIDNSDGLYLASTVIEEPDARIVKDTTVSASIILQRIPDSLVVPLQAVQMDENGIHLDVLLDPTRGIRTSIPVTVVARNKTQAAVEADNIQAGTSVVLVESESQE